ncbi:fumarylacetoacetate hydrolase family protein [Arthrobacter ramosus]|nr:fumarylacetoacetate hydrolase family protein [Arthrobacter ramosus]
MRLANVNNRAVLVAAVDNRGLDVANASGGKFGPGLMSVYENWDSFLEWAGTANLDNPDTHFQRSELGSPSPTPRQIVAVGLNYSEHAAESGFKVPDSLPPIFTKFVSSLTGPDATVALPKGGNVDWEVELVVVIGRAAKDVREEDAWTFVAGLSVGQDISERRSQLHGQLPQFSLGKSFPNFSPVGPWLVTPDELDDENDLELGCEIDGEVVQLGRTRDLVFSVTALIAKLTKTITLFPGDLIFTGTPAGVGLGRDPQRFLQPGESLRSWVKGIGELHQTFAAD